MEPVTLATDDVRVVVDPDYGGGTVRISRPDGPNLLSERSWDAPLPANRSLSYGDDALDFLADFRGGWHVLFPNTGDGCTVEGVPLPFHGELARARWEVVTSTDTHVELRCPSRLPVRYERTMTVSGSTLVVEDVARNLATWPVEVVWGHHPVCQATPDMRLDLPGGHVRVDPGWAEAHPELEGAAGSWPQLILADGSALDLRAATGEPTELFAYVEDLPAAWAAARRPRDEVGLAWTWDASTFPNLWLWVQVGGQEFPWYGQASLVALEPQSTVPASGLAAAIERDEALRLEPGEVLSTWIEATVFSASDEPVRAVSRGGSVDV